MIEAAAMAKKAWEQTEEEKKDALTEILGLYGIDLNQLQAGWDAEKLAREEIKTLRDENGSLTTKLADETNRANKAEGKVAELEKRPTENPFDKAEIKRLNKELEEAKDKAKITGPKVMAWFETEAGKKWSDSEEGQHWLGKILGMEE
jgi:DNA repair exonuclease SbcCD ATPase subunit